MYEQINRAFDVGLWAINDDDGQLDEEMLDIILRNERIILLPNCRGDLTYLLKQWSAYQMGSKKRTEEFVERQ